MANIFISYNREDEDKTKALVDDIQELGHTVWFDHELSGGQKWWDTILESVRNCDILVFALSVESLNSSACSLEYDYASKLGKTILPVLVGEGVSINLLPPILSQIQFVDYQEPDRDALLHLAKALTSAPPSQPLPDPLPLPPEVPISYLGKLGKQIGNTSKLSYEEQSALLVDLKRGLHDPETATDIRTLLKKLRKRQYLFENIAREIDELLESATQETIVTPNKDEAILSETQKKPQKQTISPNTQNNIDQNSGNRGKIIVFVTVLLLIAGGAAYVYFTSLDRVGTEKWEMNEIERQKRETQEKLLREKHEEELKHLRREKAERERAEAERIQRERVEAERIQRERAEAEQKEKELGKFLEDFYSAGTSNDISKAMAFYSYPVKTYFSKKNFSKTAVYKDKARYYKKWPVRFYKLKNYEILSDELRHGIQYFNIVTDITWQVKSNKEILNGTSSNLLKIKVLNGKIFIYSVSEYIKNKSEEIERLQQEKDERERAEAERIQREEEEARSRIQTHKMLAMNFNENGIEVSIIYPNSVRAGESFVIKATMFNHNATARMGGLTLSFPDMISLSVEGIQNSFDKLNTYTPPAKLYSSITRGNIYSKYLVIEGWQNKWAYSRNKSFSVRLTAPRGIGRLYVNVRGVLHVGTSKRNKREVIIPTYGNITDQQGYYAKQFSITIY